MKKATKCFKCQAEGHYANNCPKQISKIILDNLEDYNIHMTTLSDQSELSENGSIYEIESYFSSSSSDNE